jgi:hypothetical protein
VIPHTGPETILDVVRGRAMRSGMCCIVEDKEQA